MALLCIYFVFTTVFSATVSWEDLASCDLQFSFSNFVFFFARLIAEYEMKTIRFFFTSHKICNYLPCISRCYSHSEMRKCAIDFSFENTVLSSPCELFCFCFSRFFLHFFFFIFLFCELLTNWNMKHDFQMFITSFHEFTTLWQCFTFDGGHDFDRIYWRSKNNDNIKLRKYYCYRIMLLIIPSIVEKNVAIFAGDIKWKTNASAKPFENFQSENWKKNIFEKFQFEFNH